MDWDSENFVPAPIGSTIMNKWDGEDEDLNVKDNWEDDDEDKKREEHTKKQSQQSKKPKTKLDERIEERERKEMQRRSQMQKQELEDEINFANMTPEQMQAEKLKRQKLIEESDFEVAREMLGLSDEDCCVDNANPTTKEEFTAFKDAICKKVLCYKKSDHFSYFVEELFRDLSAGLPINDLKKVKLNLDNMFNEKSRVAKSEKGKKSKGKGKAKLRVEENDMVYDVYSAYTVDDFDDFM